MAKHIQEFLDNDYTDYAVYRVIQRLPNLLDSSGQTQRKILHVLGGLPESKKSKTAGVYNLVYSQTNYLHGDASIYNVVENLARECSNNINLLTQEGSFGYRTNRVAAAPRYTGTRFSQAARLIFRKEDHPILEKQEFEGQEIEPKFLLPIIPVGIVNGYNAIAVGYSSKFLPRDPTELIKEMIRILASLSKGNTPRPKIVQPAFPFYSGNVVHDVEHNNSAAWYLTGVLKKTKRKNWVDITEVPPEYTRESYIKKLKKMLDKGIIKDFTESCSKNTFKFSVKLDPKYWSETEDQLLSRLNLIDKFVENFTFIDSTGDITKFDHVGDYLLAFIKARLTHYQRRKDYHADRLQKEIEALKERIRFINDVNSSNIVITKRKKVDLEKELKDKGYSTSNESYDYLLGMKIYSLTAENVRRFHQVILDREEELKVLLETTPEQLHTSELKELLKFIQPELKKKELI
jgi:DNA topoisomerase-2